MKSSLENRSKPAGRRTVLFFLPIMFMLVAFCTAGALLVVERIGLSYGAPVNQQDFIPEGHVFEAAEPVGTRCLMIYSKAEETYNARFHGAPGYAENIGFVLDEMCVGYTLFDISGTDAMPQLEGYKTIILAMSDISVIQDRLPDIFEWVRRGGGLMFAQTPDDPLGLLSSVFAGALGINPELSNFEYLPQEDVYFITDIFPNTKGMSLVWSTDEESLRYGCGFVLDEDCVVHMKSRGADGETVMLWEHAYEKGIVVVNNNDAMNTRWSRGLVAVAYSLLEPVVAYPVINASVYFIDDFPAPVPNGYNEYITRDYGVTVSYFFTNTWLPDMLNLAQKYAIKYTGMIIETYEDVVHPPFRTAGDTSSFTYFGNFLLSEGFELGAHGFNHQSLVLENFDYGGELPYNKWASLDDAAAAIAELLRFSDSLFPGIELKSYIPPSNVLSSECREMLADRFPQLTVISGLYIDDVFGMYDEFEVAEDGLINVPRLSVGFIVDDIDRWELINEIALHFVNSHFVHPDDTLDPERGAESGWEKMKSAFDGHLQWLTKLPLRETTAQEAGMAVQRYHYLSMHTKYSEDKIVIDFDGFYDEAWALVRVNSGKPADVTGGSIEQVGERLYLLKAEESRVSVRLVGSN